MVVVVGAGKRMVMKPNDSKGVDSHQSQPVHRQSDSRGGNNWLASILDLNSVSANDPSAWGTWGRGERRPGRPGVAASCLVRLRLP